MKKVFLGLANKADFDKVKEDDVTQLLQSHREELTNEDLKQLEMMTLNYLYKIIENLYSISSSWTHTLEQSIGTAKAVFPWLFGTILDGSPLRPFPGAQLCH